MPPPSPPRQPGCLGLVASIARWKKVTDPQSAENTIVWGDRLGQGCGMSAEPLTIVVCYDFATVNGGQAKVAVESAVGLKRQGHRAIFFAAIGPVAPQLTAAGVEVVCLDQTELNRNASKIAALVQGTWNAPVAKALDALLATLPHDRTIVHVHGWAKGLSPSIAGPIARSRLAAVTTMHEYFQFCPNGGFYNYRQDHVCRLKPLSLACWASDCDARNYGRKLWRNARLAAANGLLGLPELFSDYIALSAFQQNIIRPLVPAASRLHRIANPVAAEDLGPKEAPATGETIFVGRLSKEKGAAIFAEAARRAGVVPTFVGDGPLLPELRVRYPEARFTGWQGAEGVTAAVRAARVLVFPSIWYEGQPLTVLEAKALGTPIVVSDACAGREEVDDGVTGLWFRSGDVDDLARALAQTRDDTRITAMAAAAYAAYWRDPLTLDRHVAKLEALYRGILSGAARDRPSIPNSVILPD